MLTLPATRVRRGHQIRLVIPGPTPVKPEPARRDEKLVALLAEAQEAQRLVLAEPDKSLATIAAGVQRCRKRMGKLLAISCLAPYIVTAVIAGKQPPGLDAKALLDIDLPVRWAKQRALFGLA